MRVRTHGNCPRCGRDVRGLAHAVTPRHGHEKLAASTWSLPCTGSGLRMKNARRQQGEHDMKESIGSLFDAQARRTDPEPSHTAARQKNERGEAQKLALEVLAALRKMPKGGTCREIAKAIGVERDSVSPRMKSLETAKLVERTSERREKQTVWRIASFSHAESMRPREPEQTHDLGGEA